MLAFNMVAITPNEPLAGSDELIDDVLGVLAPGAALTSHILSNTHPEQEPFWGIFDANRVAIATVKI